jgi:predicted component of type VI protein secretion system
MMAVHARLVVVGGDVKTSEIKLRLPCTIGRGRGSSIVLAHPLVSRQHCEIYEADGGLMVRDLGSLNGTFVNNFRISETAPLPPNELLTVGTVTFRAVYESAGPATEVETPVQTDREDTLYSGRDNSSGTGTVPFPFPPKANEDQSDRATAPASQSSMEALPPVAQLPAADPAADPASLLAPKVEPSPAAGKPADEPDIEDHGAGSSDDDLQDFLKSLGSK